MEIKIQSLHFTPTQKLFDYVNEKVEKLSHFGDRVAGGDVCLKLDKSKKLNNKVCEIKLSVPGNDLFAKHQCKTFEEAVNETVDSLQGQLRKQKTKKINRRHTKVIA
ncbi:MAG: ribosome hibernation-promoting factor, HPF/YfiA family [Bacteroidia bacterium]